MSDLLRRIPKGISSASPMLRQSLRIALGNTRGRDDDSLTPAQEDLLPYIREEAQKEADRRGLLRLTEAVFDILQRGQYLTANVAQQLVDNLRSGQPLMRSMPKAIADAVSGRVKGDWKHVLFGGTTQEGRDVEGVFDWDPETKAGKVAKGLAGFAANVFLDPTTYVSFGASTGAKQAATRFADDAVLRTIGNITKNANTILADLIQKGLDPQKLQQLWKKNTKEAFKYLQSHAGDDITRLYSKVHKEAYQRALRTPAKELTEELGEKIAKETSERVRTEGLGAAAADGASDAVRTALPSPRPKNTRKMDPDVEARLKKKIDEIRASGMDPATEADMIARVQDLFTKQYGTPTGAFDDWVVVSSRRAPPPPPRMLGQSASEVPAIPGAAPAAADDAVSTFVRRKQAGPDVMFSGDFSGMPGRIAGESGEAYSKRLLEHLGTDPYAGAGTRAWRIFRKEYNLSERYPGWLKRLDDYKAKFKDSNLGGKFSDAWWKWMEHSRSPVATIRRALRIRNPYQKLLSVFERDVQEKAFHELLIDGEAINTMLKGLSDEERKAVTGAMIFSQVQQEQARKASLDAAALGKGKTPKSPYEETSNLMGPKFRGEGDAKQQMWTEQPVILSAKEIAERFAPEGSTDSIVKAIDDINDLTGRWLKFNQDAYERGLASSIGQWEDYLPAQPSRDVGWKRAGRQVGGMQQGYAHAREVGFGGHLNEQVEKIKWMFGNAENAEELAIEAITNNFSNLNVDIADLLTRRAFAQARFRQRVHMIDTFKQFGVGVHEIAEKNPALYQGLAGKWGNLEPLGMKTIDDKALEGILFDADVAEIFERAVAVTGTGQAWDSLTNAVNNFTSWWRGWATLSPGFHMRNFMSNNMTGFLKHGVEWLDPETHIDSIIMTHVALHGKEKAIKNLSGFGEDFVRTRLAKRIGENTLEELAEYAGTTGLATRVTRGFHQPKDYEDLVKLEGKLMDSTSLNPFKRDFVGMEVSHKVGSYVESTARLSSFLLDVKKGVAQGANQQTAIEWAKREAKKWFIDYGDLSQVEQKALRNLMPFYTWIRGNIANQLSGLMQMPEMYGVAAKGINALNDQSVSKEEMPEWARDLGMVPVGPAEGEKTRFFWPNFPFQDLNKLPVRFRETEGGIPIPQLQNPGDIVTDIIADSHPVLKSVIERVTQKDIFYQDDIGDTEKAPRALRILTKSDKLIRFLDGALRQVGYEDGLRADVDKDGRLVIDWRIARVLSNNVLMLNMIPKYWDAAEVIFPVLERWKQKATGAVDDYEALEELFQVFSFYLGVKVKDIDIAESEFYNNYNIMEAAQEARALDRKKEPGAEQRSLDWRAQQTGIQRRLGL